ncbi:hypothetical protein AB205_0060570, partial [Aquarana catesbeiana]
ADCILSLGPDLLLGSDHHLLTLGLQNFHRCGAEVLDPLSGCQCFSWVGVIILGRCLLLNKGPTAPAPCNSTVVASAGQRLVALCPVASTSAGDSTSSAPANRWGRRLASSTPKLCSCHWGGEPAAFFSILSSGCWDNMSVVLSPSCGGRLAKHTVTLPHCRLFSQDFRVVNWNFLIVPGKGSPTLLLSRDELQIRVELMFDSNIGCSPVLRTANNLGCSRQIRKPRNTL